MNNDKRTTKRLKTHTVLDLHYTKDEGQGCFDGTLEECNEFVSTQHPHFMYKVVPMLPDEIKNHPDNQYNLSEHPTETETKKEEGKEGDILAHENYPFGSTAEIGSRDRSLYEHKKESFIAGYDLLAKENKELKEALNVTTIEDVKKWKEDSLDLHSLRMSLNESSLNKYFDKYKERKFNDKVILSILEIDEKKSQLEEQNKELREALEMVYKRLHIFGESNVWEDEDEMALHRAQKALTQ